MVGLKMSVFPLARNRRLLAARRRYGATLPERAAPPSFAPAGSDPAPSVVHMGYQGGRLLENVGVYSVFWGPQVPEQQRWARLYQSVTAGSGSNTFLAWLSEYSSSNQTLGKGRFVGSTVDDSAPIANGTFSPGLAAARLGSLMENGLLPTNDSSSIFMLHLPDSVTGPGMCTTWLGYHLSFPYQSRPYACAVIPRCGKFNSWTATHELIEAITDPDPLQGWSDVSFGESGEIADVCETAPATFAGQTVASGWSNSHNACIAAGVIIPFDDASSGSLSTGAFVAVGFGVSAAVLLPMFFIGFLFYKDERRARRRAAQHIQLRTGVPGAMRSA